MPEELEVEKTVTCYPQDLEDIHNALSSVYHFCLSQDLANQYKNLSNKVQLSPLTKEVKRMQDRILLIIEDANEDEEIH